jgi:LysR family glycine cleavage system transcriptional activator
MGFSAYEPAQTNVADYRGVTPLDRLPLSSVRTFTVVARLLSISRAAEELNVTPSAVSHQIKTLEQYLGAPLFNREKNKLSLTAAGTQYMAHASEALSLLARATKMAKASNGHETLRIGVPPSLACLWLVRRLGEFVKARPDIPLAIVASPDPLALQGAFDVGFWYGSGLMPGITVYPLGPNRVFPICKPSLLKGDQPLRSPADLPRYLLLDSTDDSYYPYKEPRQPGWYAWLQHAGACDPACNRHMNLTPRLLMHTAVAAGIGVGLSRTLLAIDALLEKELIVPFGPAPKLSLTYNLVVPSHIARRKDVSTFCDWVLAEAASSTKKAERLLKPFAMPPD